MYLSSLIRSAFSSCTSSSVIYACLQQIVSRTAINWLLLIKDQCQFFVAGHKARRQRKLATTGGFTSSIGQLQSTLAGFGTTGGSFFILSTPSPVPTRSARCWTLKTTSAVTGRFPWQQNGCRFGTQPVTCLQSRENFNTPTAFVRLFFARTSAVPSNEMCKRREDVY